MFKKLLASLTVLVLGSVHLFVQSPYADGYSDVEEDTDYATAIEYLTFSEAVEGYEDDTYKPEQSINRAEFAKILVGGRDLEPSLSSYHSCFLDVLDDWYAPYVCYLKDAGVVEGYSDGNFKPEAAINKVEAVKMLILFMWDLTEEEVDDGSYESVEKFSDIDRTAWYTPYLDFAKERNLLEVGDSYVFYYPNDELTRGLMAEYTVRSVVTQEMSLAAYHEYDRDRYFVQNGMELSEDFPCYSTGDHKYYEWVEQYAEAEYEEVTFYDHGYFCPVGDDVLFSTVMFADDEFKRQLLFFNEDGELQEHLTVDCAVAGDIPAVTLEIVDASTVYFVCSGADAGYSFADTYELGLGDFSYELVNRNVNGEDVLDLAYFEPQDEFEELAFSIVEDIHSEGADYGTVYTTLEFSEDAVRTGSGNGLREVLDTGTDLMQSVSVFFATSSYSNFSENFGVGCVSSYAIFEDTELVDVDQPTPEMLIPVYEEKYDTILYALGSDDAREILDFLIASFKDGTVNPLDVWGICSVDAGYTVFAYPELSEWIEQGGEEDIEWAVELMWMEDGVFKTALTPFPLAHLKHDGYDFFFPIYFSWNEDEYLNFVRAYPGNVIGIGSLRLDRATASYELVEACLMHSGNEDGEEWACAAVEGL